MSEPGTPPHSNLTDATTKAAAEGASPDAKARAAVLRPPLEQIGNYRLVKQLGAGGMGEVWLAQHVENQHLQAAVKFIRSDHVDPGIHGRFQRERETLVRLRHENIVKVSDLGVTPNGLAYLLMEYVEGASLVAYCDSHRLSVRQRLELFLQVCRAVQHAHAQGLIHRDLKPANILVAEVEEKGGVRAVAKVIDFGIARAMESGEAAEDSPRREGPESDSMLTQTGMFIGSLLYASPEQLLTQPVDVRTDVYSLGAILYQLLSGTLPIGVQEAQALLREARAQVLERQSSTSRIPPSDKVRSVAKTNPKLLAQWAEARGVLAEELAKLLAHELDWITLKAIEPDRERRYRNAEAFASDVERYLQDEIVEARKPDWKYRSGKVWRRHRRRLIAVALIAVALIGALFTVQIFQQRANTEAARAKDEQHRAEEQRKLAQEYAATAEQQKAEALKQRQEAEQQRKEAENQKAKAEAAAERERTTAAVFPLPGDGTGEAWRLIKINGRDFVYVDELAKFYSLAPPKRDGDDFEAGSKNLRINGTMDSAEFLINGLKFILSFPLIEVQGQLLISRMDLTKIVEPVLRPSKIVTTEKVETVVLDPGGGGSEGIKSTYGMEREFTLDVANQAQALLTKEGYKVVLTRTNDNDVSDADRVKIANQSANALFVSIHFNTGEPADTGIETYTLAPRGVPSMVVDGDEGSVLDAHPGNVNDARNIALATAVHASFVVHSHVYDGGIKRARFAVIRDVTIPGVLIKGGYLSNAEDAKLIATTEYRKQMASSILEGVKNYRRAVEWKAPQPGAKSSAIAAPTSPPPSSPGPK